MCTLETLSLEIPIFDSRFKDKNRVLRYFGVLLIELPTNVPELIPGHVLSADTPQAPQNPGKPEPKNKKGERMGIEQIFAVAVILVIPVALNFLVTKEKKRKEAFTQLARELGLNYHPQDPGNIVEEYMHLDFLHLGHNPGALNVVEGRYRGQNILFFDLFYTLMTNNSAGSYSSTNYLSVVMVKLPDEYPKLMISPARLLEWAERWSKKPVMDQRFDPGDKEFSRKCVVRTEDGTFAGNFLQTQLKKRLLEQKDPFLGIDGGIFFMVFLWRVKPRKLKERLDMAIDLREFLPKHPPGGWGGA